MLAMGRPSGSPSRASHRICFTIQRARFREYDGDVGPSHGEKGALAMDCSDYGGSCFVDYSHQEVHLGG